MHGINLPTGSRRKCSLLRRSAKGDGEERAIAGCQQTQREIWRVDWETTLVDEHHQSPTKSHQGRGLQTVVQALGRKPGPGQWGRITIGAVMQEGDRGGAV